MINWLRNISIVSLLAILLSVGLFGATMRMSQNHATMTACSDMQENMAFCSFDAAEYVSVWRAAVPASSMQQFAAALGIFLFALFAYALARIAEQGMVHRERWRTRSIAGRRLQSPFFYSLLFSQGILNPKTY